MNVARTGHATALLLDGTVLVSGGAEFGANLYTDHASAEIYDPVAERWSLVGTMNQSRRYHTATLLPDGRVLVVGGLFFTGDDSIGHQTHYLPSVELYDPQSGVWTFGAPLSSPRANHTATLLSNGDVLVVGGSGTGGQKLATAERYDPATNTWRSAGSLSAGRDGHRATRLDDGRILVTGGQDLSGPTTAERYDPVTDVWSRAASMGTIKGGHTATLLPNGEVLATADEFLAERYDPIADRWRPAARMRTRRFGAEATALGNGNVLVVGGLNYDNGSNLENFYLATADIYDSEHDAWLPAGIMTTRRVATTMVLLPSGQALIIGGEENYRSAVNTAEVFDDGLVSGFPQTGMSLRGSFLDRWQKHGGLSIYGFPLTDLREERLENGRTYMVQWFERARFEYHPENPAPYNVLLGQFGRQLHPADPPVTANPGAAFFPQTGHNLGGRFRAFWEANGGLAQFGYPLSEEFTETLDGAPYNVQYFERARFEYHPENPPPFDVLLGQFGRRLLGGR